MKNSPQKIAIYLLAFGVMSFGIAMAVEYKQRAGDNPIEVRTEDGQMPVDVTYARSYSNPPYRLVTVTCPMAENITAKININVLTYNDQDVSQDVIDEIQELACEVLNGEPQVTWGNVRYEETK